MIIAIDGPSGAGKSTLGKRLAATFELTYLDTGAMYRAVGLAALRVGLDENDRDAIETVSEGLRIELPGTGADLRVLLNGEDVTERIRSKDVSHMASVVSTIPGVRTLLVKRQRQIGRSAGNGAVLDGRDIGSVVFPDADYKFYLTAGTENRARRRYLEDKDRGRDTSYEQTLNEIIERDERDATREFSPLVKAEDAIEIDTSDLNVDEVFEKMARIIRDSAKGSAGLENNAVK
ncbi:MAG: (d)CMP kinase [Acidobacteriota bacterium]|nr:(d)CMP kinase [Acidobacteriota bacterium]MDH3530613.1 (d)CMP kinase [Acidobacteriota bacterium]